MPPLSRLSLHACALAAAVLVTGLLPAQIGIAREDTPAFRTLYSFAFQLSHQPSEPEAGLIFGPSGSFYGTTLYGGASEYGTVFELTKSGSAWNVKPLYAFGTRPGDGLRPAGAVTMGPDGTLYGMTSVGGAWSEGTVYALSPPEAPDKHWREAVLYDFQTGSDGQYPNSSLIIGPGGVLYGTTTWGGTAGVGTVFALTPPAMRGGVWTETILHNFAGSLSVPSGDGAWPFGILLIGTDRALYGTTYYGGSGHCPYTCGIVFRLAPPARTGGEWDETIVYNFAGQPNDGLGPFSGLAMDTGGTLYGTTYKGGPYNDCILGCGTVYELTPPAGRAGAWTETVIHEFTTDYIDGLNPLGGLSIGANGVLYGTTQNGGTQDDYCNIYCGIVFKLTPSKRGVWTEKVLHNFTDQNGNGESPEGTLLIGAHGTIYGTTVGGGVESGGTAFKITPR